MQEKTLEKIGFGSVALFVLAFIAMILYIYTRGGEGGS